MYDKTQIRGVPNFGVSALTNAPSPQHLYSNSNPGFNMRDKGSANYVTEMVPLVKAGWFFLQKRITR